MPYRFNRYFAPFSQEVKLRNRPLYGRRVALAGGGFFVFWLIVSAFRWFAWDKPFRFDVLFGFMAIIGGIGLFLFQQHLNETKLFAELFEKFNKRYDAMNKDLQALLKIDRPFEEDDRLTVIDYFNLCAEEHLFYRAGYIDEFVWNAWASGMRGYAQDARIRQLWQEERGDTYYGFEFPPDAKSDHRRIRSAIASRE